MYKIILGCSSKLILLLFALSALSLNSALAISNSSTPVNTSSPSICGSSDPGLSTLEDITNNSLPSGNTYLKLNYLSTPIKLSLYLNGSTTNSCTLIGSIDANSTSWVYVGNIPAGSDDVIIQGIGVNAAPYQAAVQMLVLPSSICTPNTSCDLKYHNLSGSLQLDNSNILSGSTDQIAIYGVKPVIGASIQSISYYADNQKGALYSNKTLSAFNRNYLDGGIHQTQIQIKIYQVLRYM